MVVEPVEMAAYPTEENPAPAEQVSFCPDCTWFLPAVDSCLPVNRSSCFQEGNELMEWWNSVKGEYEHLFCFCSVFLVILSTMTLI